MALGEQMSLNGKFNPRSAVAAQNNPESEHIEKVSIFCEGKFELLSIVCFGNSSLSFQVQKHVRCASLIAGFV